MGRFPLKNPAGTTAIRQKSKRILQKLTKNPKESHENLYKKKKKEPNDPFRVSWINKSQNWAETGQNPIKILPKRAGKILKNSPERGSRDP